MHHFDLLSHGYDTFNGQLKHAMSAHSKVDRSTGELFVFSADMEKPKAFCSVFDAERNLKNSFEVPLSSVRIIHEFLITSKYAIIPDLPLEIDIMNAIFNK